MSIHSSTPYCRTCRKKSVKEKREMRMKIFSLFKRKSPPEIPRLSYWQQIFYNSKLNGGRYDGDELPVSKWEFPRNTWFEQRLRGRE